MQRVLTGITTSGTPHLGNYVGAIRPAIAASRAHGVESFLFLADLHALIKTGDPARVARSTREIAATWLALGLDPARVVFYRQSAIPGITELYWLLTCVTAKGLLNRAHAYKAAVDANVVAGVDPDAGISAGLYQYPVLMAADIVLFNASHVPVGRDQVQHIEMARDIAQRFNHLFPSEPPHFTLPEAVVDDSVAVLPGLDGRKMSKSYDNTIPLWLDPAALRKSVYGIVTSSQAPGEPKDPGSSHLFQIYRAFATADEAATMARDYADGVAWGKVKEQTVAVIERELAPSRERYAALMDAPCGIDEVLARGAERARAVAAPVLARCRDAVGLRSLASSVTASEQVPLPAVKSIASTRSWRERDGSFRFRLISAIGTPLVESVGFGSHAEARTALDDLVTMSPDQRRRNAVLGAKVTDGVRIELYASGDRLIATSAALPGTAAVDALYADIERALADLGG